LFKKIIKDQELKIEYLEKQAKEYEEELFELKDDFRIMKD
jgi:hypothetical protein